MTKHKPKPKRKRINPAWKKAFPNLCEITKASFKCINIGPRPKYD